MRLSSRPAERGGGPRAARWEGPLPHGRPQRRMPPPPCFAWSPSPAPFHCAKADKRYRSRDADAPELCSPPQRQLKKSPPHTHDPEKWCPVFGQDHAQKREAKRRKAHANHFRAAPTNVAACSYTADKCTQSAPLICCAAARQFRARPPSGAPPRHSPGRTRPPLAQLQFPRFLRPGLAGVTRFGLSQVYRAPRRPVVVPVER